MCGIIAFLLQRASVDAKTVLLNGILQLQNRGYDSVGFGIFDKEYHIWKQVSQENKMAVESMEEELMRYGELKSGMAHTRWATHGPKTTENAHPHQGGNFWLIHNGILENYLDLKKDDIYQSQTDTEVIAKWINRNVKMGDKDTITKEMANAIQSMNGTWALIIQNEEYPDTLWVVKHGSPLCIAYDNGNWYVGSEPSCLPCSHYYSITESMLFYVEDQTDQIHLWNPRSQKIEVISWNVFIQDTLRIRDVSLEIKSPSPYSHWMIREIMEQKDVIRRAFNNGGRLPENKWVHLGGIRDFVPSYQNICLVGCGTSLYAAQWGSYWIRKHIPNLRVDVVDASEWDNDQWEKPNTLYVYLSQSGETKDVHRAVCSLKGCHQLGIINVVESLLAREIGRGIYCNAGPERAVASTKSFTAQCVILGLLTLWLSGETFLMRRFRADLLELPREMDNWLIMNGELHLQMRELGRKLSTAQRCFCLGRGSTVAIAYESALKLKEVCYLHAEGFVGGSLKHGPFSLIEPGTPVFVIHAKTDGEEITKKQLLAAEETRTRGAFVIWVSDYPLNDRQRWCVDEVIAIPEGMGLWGSLGCIIPVQLLAYEMALVRRINPDYPRNLAKVVTVDG